MTYHDYATGPGGIRSMVDLPARVSLMLYQHRWWENREPYVNEMQLALINQCLLFSWPPPAARAPGFSPLRTPVSVQRQLN